MKIKINYANTDYTINADGVCFTLIRHGVNQDKKSASFGQPTEINLGYFSKFDNAIGKIVKDVTGSMEDEVSLQEYATIIRDANNSIADQLQVLGI